MKKRFTEEQIIQVLGEVKKGLKVEEVCRKYGISHPTYYNWKSKYDGMTVPDAQKLRSLESENTKLKRLVADLSLDNVALKDALTRKW